MKRRYTAIMIPYVLGMGSFFIVDLVIARVATTEMIASWAATKSVVMIGSTLVLLGLDQVMVRLPQQASFILKVVFIQIPILSVLYILLLSLLGVIRFGVWEVLAVFAVAISLAQFGFYRAKNQLFTSQLSSNTWRLTFLGLILAAVYFSQLSNYSLLIVIAVALATLLNIVINRFYKEPEVVPAGQDETISGIYALGGRFFVSLATLNIAVFMEQVMLNMTGHTEASASYFTHSAIILPLLIAFNGFAGFLLGPYIRKNIPRFDKYLVRYWWGLPLGALIMSGVAFALSILLYMRFYDHKLIYDYRIALMIVFIGFLRIIYILPSSYLGVAAKKHFLTQFVNVNVASVILSIIAYFGLVHMDVHPAFAVAFSSLFNWGTRTLIGLYLVKRIFDTRKLLSEGIAS